MKVYDATLDVEYTQTIAGEVLTISMGDRHVDILIAGDGFDGPNSFLSLSKRDQYKRVIRPALEALTR